MSIRVPRHLDLETRDIQVREHAIVHATGIVKRKLRENTSAQTLEEYDSGEPYLEVEGILVRPRGKGVRRLRRLLIEDTGCREDAFYFVQQLLHVSRDLHDNRASAGYPIRTLWTSNSVRFLSDCSWWGCRGPDRRVRLSPSSFT